jgi:hypothetical protein
MAVILIYGDVIDLKRNISDEQALQLYEALRRILPEA